MTNKKFLDVIKSNIDKQGFHIMLVNGGQHPDFSYSIGLTEKLGFELIVAGGAFVSIKENESIFEYIYLELQTGQVQTNFMSIMEKNYKK